MSKNDKFCEAVNRYFDERWAEPTDYVLTTTDNDGIIFYVYAFPLKKIPKNPSLISKWIVEHLEPFIHQYKIEVPIVFTYSFNSEIYYELKTCKMIRDLTKFLNEK